MSETINVEHAFDPEARQAQKDMDAFLDTRPYADRADGKHHPVTGEYIDIDDEALTTGDLHTDKNHFQVARDQFEVDSMPTAYEDMTMPDLARALASAEHAADKTKSEDIQDVLADKMSEFSEKNNLDNDAQDNLWNRIMKVKDTEADQLSGGKVTKSTEAGSGDDGEVMPLPGDESASADDEKEASKNTKFEVVSTSDLDEATAFWEAELKDQNIKLEDYLSHEKQWLVKRPITVSPETPTEDPSDQDPESPTVDPSDQDPELPPVDPSDGGGSDEPTVIQPSEGDGEKVSRPDQTRSERVRKWGRGLLAGLALLGGGYTAGRAHENYIVKVDDTPAVDSINKMEDNTRKLSTETQEKMVSNYEQTKKFFADINTEAGAQNFKNFEKIYEDTVTKMTEKYGDTLSEERIAQLAGKEVKAKLAALDYQDAKAKADK